MPDSPTLLLISGDDETLTSGLRYACDDVIQPTAAMKNLTTPRANKG